MAWAFALDMAGDKLEAYCGGSEPAEEYEAEKRMAREYLAQTDFEDARVRENIAIPGYN